MWSSGALRKNMNNNLKDVSAVVVGYGTKNYTAKQCM